MQMSTVHHLIYSKREFLHVRVSFGLGPQLTSRLWTWYRYIRLWCWPNENTIILLTTKAWNCRKALLLDCWLFYINFVMNRITDVFP